MISGKVSARPVLTGKVVGPVITDGGYEKGHADGEAAGYKKGHADGVVDGIEQGKQAEWENFWDALQRGGTRTNYENAFVRWGPGCYKPKYIPKPKNNIIRMFNDAEVQRIDLTNLDATEITTGGVSAFSSNYIEYLELDIPNCTVLSSSLYYMRGLKTLKLHNMNQCLLGTLIQANILENVEFSGTFGGEYMEMLQSSLLSYESLQNIIEAAYDYGTNPVGQTHRIGLNATAKKKLTEADIAKLTQKGWTLT